MAKQRLVDFRGGINAKVSPHMIGDTQGQDAVDIDFSTVRLEGRNTLNSSETAKGSFLYDPGDGTNPVWVSIYPSDADSSATFDPYIEYSSDFAVWNRDLYVAVGAPVHPDSNGDLVAVTTSDHNGQIVRYLDGIGSGAQTLSFNPPAAVTLDLTDDWNTEIIPSIDVESAPAWSGQSGIVTTGTTAVNYSEINESLWDTATGSSDYYYTSPTYVEEAAAGGRDYYLTAGSTTKFYVGGSGTSTFTGEVSGYFYTRSNDTLQNQSLGVTTSNAADFEVTSTGGLDSNRKFTQGTAHGVNANGTQYYNWSSSLGSNLYGQAANNGTPITTGTPSGTTTGVNFSGAVTESNYTQLGSSANPVTSQYYSPYDTGWYDTRNGTSNQVFNRYSDNYGTVYYAPQSPLVSPYTTATVGNFYTQGPASSPQTTYNWGAEQYDRVNSGPFYGTASRFTYFSIINYISTLGYIYAEIWYNNSQIWVDSQRSGISASTYASYFSEGGSLYPITVGGKFYKRVSYVGTVNTNYGTIDFWTVSEATSSSVTYADYSYNLHTRSESTSTYYAYPTTQVQATKYFFPANMTYSVWSDTLPTVSEIPSTDAFLYDDARAEIYQRNTAAGTPATINDESRGDNWLAEGRAFSGPDVASAYGYFLKSVRDSSGLPSLSNTEVRASVSTGTDVMQSDALHSPQRINFSITAPSDNTAQGGDPAAYRLYRKDNNGTVDLGYIKPSRLNTTDYSTDITFTFDSTAKTVTIANLRANSNYRLKWWAYQQSRVSSITVDGGTANTSIAAKSNTTGFSIDSTGFTSSSTVVIQLATSTSGDVRIFACDFWLEESVLDGVDPNSLLDNTFAVIKCYDILYDTAYDNIDTNHDGVADDVATTVQGTSDFLDLFASDLLNDGLGNSAAVNAPDYCKFLKESNNFFFAVGSSLTSSSFYGGSNNVNKKGSYLFVSEYNDPTTWYATGYIQFDSEITGLHSYPGELIVWTSNGTYRVTGSRYDQMRKTKLATTEGMPDGQHRTAVLVNNYLVWLSQSGICLYDGRGVTNLTRGRFENFGFSNSQKRLDGLYDLPDAVGTGLHAGQSEGIYYLLGNDETGYAVDFNLEGFPITRVDMKEGQTADIASTPAKVPVLVYSAKENELLSRKGRVAQGSGTAQWTYKTRDFDGGAFGSLKLVQTVVVNGTGSGIIQVYLDGDPVFSGSGKNISIDYTPNDTNQPARVYIPASVTGSTYGLPIADVWSVEIVDWRGQIDWIDTEFQIVSGA